MDGARGDDPGVHSEPGLTIGVLTAADVDDIHAGTLAVLEQTGVLVEDDAALDLFADGSCVVDRETHVVRFPGQVVEEAIRACPHEQAGAGAGESVRRPEYANFDEGIFYVDPWTGERRDPGREDVAHCARLVDALPNIDSYAAAVRPRDVPAATAAVHGCRTALLETSKSVGSEATSAWEVRVCAELGACVSGGMDRLRTEETVSFGICPVSPLQLPREATEVIVECARLGLSDTILSMAMAGGSAPVTLAGTLVVHNAEVLSGIVLAQLTEPGVPVVYGSSTTAMDLRSGAAAVGTPEIALIGVAVAQLAHRYRLPSLIAGM